MHGFVGLVGGIVFKLAPPAQAAKLDPCTNTGKPTSRKLIPVGGAISMTGIGSFSEAEDPVRDQFNCVKANRGVQGR